MAQALADHFDLVVGVDGSEEMVRLARELNRVGERCRFVGSPFPDLRLFRDGEFDAVFSVYVLQHLPQWLMARYLREFARVTRPGGSLVFQVHGGLTSGWADRWPEPWVSYAYNRWIRRPGAHPGRSGSWEVHWIHPKVVADLLRPAGVTLDSVDRSPKPDGRLWSDWYFGTRIGERSRTRT